MPRPNFDLYLITDPTMPGGLVGSVESALCKGVPKGRVAVQLRAKTLSTSELVEVGRLLRSITHEAGAALLVNGPWQVAAAIDADGIQVPEGDSNLAEIRSELGPNALLGRSCHDLAGVIKSAAAADFVTLSPYFPVPGKAPPLSVESVREICQAAAIPVFALGGITPDRVSAAIESGAHGVAAIRGVLATKKPSHSLHALLEGLDRSRLSQSADNGEGGG